MSAPGSGPVGPEPETQTTGFGEMPFTDHLEELRRCVVKTFAAIFVAGVLAFFWADQLFRMLTFPLRESFTHMEPIGTGLAEGFLVKIKVAIFMGIVVSLPYTFYQLWRFIAPGLHTHERQVALPFVFFSTVFFLTGASFCFFVVFPFAFEFFEAEYLSIGVKPQIRIAEYLSFCLEMLLVFGVTFELPILAYFLARLDLLTHHFLVKHLRIAVVLIFIVAAILTPPDVATQVLLAIPLLILYGLCIAVVRYVEKSKEAAKTGNKKHTTTS